MSELLDRLNAAYTYPAKTEPWYPRASSCGGCLREMAHLASGMTGRPNTPEQERTFELGHQRGAELARRAKKIWPDAELEMEVQIPLPGTDYTMPGHLDLWIPTLRTVVDFKTGGGFKMGQVRKGEVGEDYELQLQAYRHGVAHSLAWGLLPSTPGPDTIRCVLIFEAKDSDARNGVTAGQLVEVEVPHTDELEQRFQARMAALAEILRQREEGTLDPTTFEGKDKDHWKCRVAKDGTPRFCKVGPTLGKCH